MSSAPYRACRQQALLLLIAGVGACTTKAEIPAPTEHAEAWNPVVETPSGRRIEIAPSAWAPGQVPDSPYVIAKLRGAGIAHTRQALRAAGYREITSLPYGALLVERTGASAARAIPGVVAWLDYRAEDRISRELDATALAARGTGVIPIMIHVMPGQAPDRVIERLRAHGHEIEAAGTAGIWGRVVATVPAIATAALSRDLAALPEVFFIERIHHIGMLNDRGVGTLQSGINNASAAATTIWNHGIRGQGQVVGIIDTGVDVDSCYFDDPAASLPVANTWSQAGGYGTNVDTAHRKIIAYDFLYSCDQYPDQGDCESPANTGDWDNHGHGTHVSGNMSGDRDNDPMTYALHDGVAPAAKLVVQDGGFGGDDCADLPGLGCPVIDLYPLFEQAYTQGVRLHNNSYGDNENAPAPNQSSYSARSQDVDRFVWDHRDMLIVFAAGNAGSGSEDFTVGSPSTNKNGLSIGSSRRFTSSPSDEDISGFSSRGWTGDGRIKPDLMAPGCNRSGGTDAEVGAPACLEDGGCGTSYAAPMAVGAAALARQYFTDGFYPVGQSGPGFVPSAALLKATLINSAASMTGQDNSGGPISPIPSNEQGWGQIRLDRTLAFAGSAHQLYVDDHRTGIQLGDSTPRHYILSAVDAAQPLKITLVWTDFPGTPDSPPAAPEVDTPATWTASRLVNDLDLVVTGPDGTYLGNVFAGGQSMLGGEADRRNNVEQVLLGVPAPGDYTVTVSPTTILEGDQEFALVVTGGIDTVTSCLAAELAIEAEVVSQTAAGVTIGWTQLDPMASEYLVERTTGTCEDGPWTPVGTTMATELVDTDIALDTHYLYRVTVLGLDELCTAPVSGCLAAMVMGEPDAGAPGEPDAGAPGEPDAGAPGEPDAGAPGEPDAGTPGGAEPGGCGCQVGKDRSLPGWPLLACWFGLALMFLRRRAR